MLRRSMLSKVIVFVFSTVLLLTAVEFQSASGQTLQSGEAILSASGFRTIPDRAKVRLQLADDTDINLRLRAIAIQALTRAGYAVVDADAAFTLRLESERLLKGRQTDLSIGSLRAGSSVGRPEGNAGGPRGDGVDLNLRLWSSTKNSLLNPKSAGVAAKQGFAVVIKAFDEAAHKPAWHGIARAPDSGGDSYRTGSAMVKHLIDALGLTVDQEIVSLR